MRHLHDGVILLLRPESFTFFLSYLNLVIPARFTKQKHLFAGESKTLKVSRRSSKMTPSCKWTIISVIQETIKGTKRVSPIYTLFHR